MRFSILPRGRRAWIRALLVMATGPLLILAGGCYMFSMPGRSHRGPLPPLAAEEVALRDRLAGHVRALAGRIGERHTGRPEALEASARYLEETLRGMGYAPEAQPFEAGGGTVRNLDADRAGAARPEEILVVGAHYDTAPETPGANDNATGVAAVLEIARAFAAKRPALTVRFACFVNEEPPYFQTDRMGSRVHSRRARERGERIVGMISLETIGYYRDEKGSQRYPFPFNLLYPDTGNFIGFVGNLGSRGFVRRCIGSFRRHTPFPSEGVAAPGSITGIGWSDHWSYWQEGYAALMVTDTAPFRYPHYHMPADTPEQVDFDRLARVTAGMGRVVGKLAEGG